MENFQLYRTNLFLGGQMKLDLILDSSNNALSVSDIHLRPISNNMLYSYTENLLNNSHQDNVKSYYNSIKDKFYVESLDYEFTHNWPLESTNDKHVTNYCNIFDMGCRRMRYYHYNKQFEFFCPLWIEYAKKSIVFEINVSPLNVNTTFAKKYLKIDLENPKTKFDKYLSEYFKDAKLIEGDSNVMNIDFSSKNANITGLNVASGVFCNNDVSNIINVLTEIERPLMETDNILIKAFEESSMIAKQLINFNLCFNIEDLIDSEIANLIKGNMFNISVNIYIDGNKLDIKDFYTNYDFIDRVITNESDTKINVLDYLHDNEYINLIDKNKYTQNICHWSLSEDPMYIFNLYEGFSGINIEKNPNSKSEDDKYIYTINEHYYRNTPNNTAINVTNENNSASWINTYNVNSWTEVRNFIIKENYKIEKSTLIDSNTKYINGLRYDNIYINDPIYILSICTSNKFFKLLKSNYTLFKLDIIDISDDINIYYRNNYYIICTSNINKLAYNTFSNIILSHSNDNSDIVKTLKSMFESKIDPKTIVIDKVINYNTAIGPILDVNEISYVKNSKDDNDYIYLFRYYGNIKPTFLDSKSNIFNNVLYYKDTIKDINNSKYSKYLKTGFSPIYPSIDYCSINKIDDWSYEKKPIHINSNDIEYSWFNSNAYMLLLSDISFKFCSSTKEFDKIINEKIFEIIKQTYNCEDDIANYICNCYEKYVYWEYELENDINKLNYLITLRLK